MADEEEKIEQEEVVYEFEQITPWDGEKDTGYDVRMKWKRNFERVSSFIEEVRNKLADQVKNVGELFLRKDQDDATTHSLGVGGNLTVGGMTDENGEEVEGGNGTFAGDVNVAGRATLGEDLTVGGMSVVEGESSVGGNQTVMGDSNIGGSQKVEGSQTVKGDSLIEGLLSLLKGAASPDFLAGFLGTGFELRRVAETGRWRMEIDELLVRVVATFFELVIQKLRHVGGAIVLTPASMQCVRVEETADAYRCYFKASEGDKTVANEFVVGDQARCQSFNLKSLDGGGVQTSFYWRLVTAVGDDYIELSKTDCAALSGVPAAGDDMVQLGNRDDATRQNAIILDTTGSDAPSIKQYKGINGYVLTDDMAVTVLSPAGNRIRGRFVSEATGAGVDDSLSALGEQLVSIGEQMKLIKVDVATVKDQTDREFTIWLMDVDPTTSNFPASEWTTEELKSEHVEDMYYNEDAGHAWSWTKGEDGVYYWKDITDKDTLRALEKAAKAQDTADGKRRNFVSQPTDADAYDVGDTWSNAEWTGKYYQDLLVCIKAKAAGEAFSIDHWKVANFASFARLAVMEDNINSTVAENKEAADAAIAEAKSAASEAKTAADEAKTAAGTNATAIVQNTNAISALSGKFTFDSDGNVKNIDKSGLLLSADAAKLYTTIETTNALGDRVTAAESSITTTAGDVTALAKKFTFDSNGNVTNVNQSGVVLTSNFASLFTVQMVNNELVKRAEISTMVTKDANGYLQSGVKVKADQINMEGYTTINGGFKVMTNGDVEMNNATVSGSFFTPYYLIDTEAKLNALSTHDGVGYLTTIFLTKEKLNVQIGYWKYYMSGDNHHFPYRLVLPTTDDLVGAEANIFVDLLNFYPYDGGIPVGHYTVVDNGSDFPYYLESSTVVKMGGYIKLKLVQVKLKSDSSSRTNVWVRQELNNPS